MGTAVSKDIAESYAIQKKNPLLKQEASEKKLVQIAELIKKEYPYLCGVKESVLVTDATKPDCPIIYANDDFQRMALYPKEQIIGRNCRFLQGPHTNKDMVKKIRHAVDNGLELDVELLNYRKDGTPFWNNFLMLPVHKDGIKTEKTLYFIAIQKDVTTLKQGSKPVSQWTPQEVSLYLFYLGFPHYSETFINNDIDGFTFLQLQEDDLHSFGIERQEDIDKIMSAIKVNLEEMMLLLEEKQIEEQEWPRDGEEDDPVSEMTESEIPQSPSEMQYFLDAHKAMKDYYQSKENDENLDVNKPRQLDFWNQKPTYLSNLCCKCYVDEEISLFTFSPSSRLSSFKRQCRKAFEECGFTKEKGVLSSKNISIQFLDESTGKIVLLNEQTYERAKDIARSQTLKVYLNHSQPLVPSFIQEQFDEQDIMIVMPTQPGDSAEAGKTKDIIVLHVSSPLGQLLELNGAKRGYLKKLNLRLRENKNQLVFKANRSGGGTSGLEDEDTLTDTGNVSPRSPREKAVQAKIQAFGGGVSTSSPYSARVKAEPNRPPPPQEKAAPTKTAAAAALPASQESTASPRISKTTKTVTVAAPTKTVTVAAPTTTTANSAAPAASASSSSSSTKSARNKKDRLSTSTSKKDMRRTLEIRRQIPFAEYSKGLDLEGLSQAQQLLVNHLSISGAQIWFVEPSGFHP